MWKLLTGIACYTLLWPPFLSWAKRQTETQIDKMQEAAFDSPGAEAPVPPQVVAVTIGLLIGHVVLSQGLRLRWWQSFFSLAIGSALGILLFMQRQGR